MKSLYDRLGGEAAVMTAVDIFYKKVLDDPTIASFFDQIDMAAQARKQLAFMTYAFDGPAEYRGRDMRSSHSGLALTDEHFDAVAGHLRDTLEEIGVPGDLADEVLHVVGTTRNEVLGR